MGINESHAQVSSLFNAAAQPEMVFPLPLYSMPISTTTTGGAYGSHYGLRNSLGIYHYQGIPSRFGHRASDSSRIHLYDYKDLYLYSFSHFDYNSYNSQIVYRFTTPGDTTTVQRGIPTLVVEITAKAL